MSNIEILENNDGSLVIQEGYPTKLLDALSKHGIIE